MKKEKDKYVVTGILYMQGKEFYFAEYTWLGFMKRINDMLEQYQITYPIGEDDDTQMVTKMVKETDKFR